MEGGPGYTPTQVADMTPDQIVFRLVSLKSIKSLVGGKQKQSATQVLSMMDADGFIKARDAEGNLIKLRAAPGGSSGKMVPKKSPEEMALLKKRQRRRNNGR